MDGWKNIHEEEPPKDGTQIIVANYQEELLLWVSSVWFDDTDQTWNCDFTDSVFEKSHFYDFNYWKYINS